MSRYKNFAVFMGLALVAVSGQTAEPTIKYEVTGNELILTYSGTLYQSTDAISWTEVKSASSPYKVSLNDKQLFFCSQGGEVHPVVPGEDFSVSLPGGVSLDMNWIKPGTFLMGSPKDELGRSKDRYDETQHQVTLTQGYWLGKYEVTQAQYEAIMGMNPSLSKGVDLPVEKVSWNDALFFCSNLTAIEREAGRLPEGYEYTLPTEAQWEYACRAGTTTALNSGKDLSAEDRCPEMDEVGWYVGNATNKTHPVGQKKPNAWGLYDMHGNVWEWCLDMDAKAYPVSPVTDPLPSTGIFPVVRGGAFFNPAEVCRSANRGVYNSSTQGTYVIGFRVVLAPTKNMTIPLSDKVDLDMIWINPGTFTMGSPEDELGRSGDEDQHQVTLTQGYWLGKFEVTQAQYEAVMGTNPSNWKGADLPVEQVSWNDAMDFCAKLTAIEKAAGRLPEGYEYTLPTEAQWEYACRAGTTTALNSGKNLSDEAQCPEMDSVGWYDGNSDEMTHPVGQKQPNAWGLYDMHGNVWEWCLDWYEEDYPTSAVTDPTGPDTGSKRIIRGGTWYYYAIICRSAYRNYSTPDYSDNDYGFRVALAPSNIIIPLTPGENGTVPLSDTVSLDMIWINPGTFTMGSPEDELGRGGDEDQHEVTLTKGYWLGKYEITQAQYEAIMETNPSRFKGADLPVEKVSWLDATEFCAKLTAIEREAGRLPEGYEYTLPTEAQWEYACRAGTTTAFNNGTNIETDDQIYGECPNLDPVGWYWCNSDETTHPVGLKQPNAWGLYDMHGNVMEWCQDAKVRYPTTPVIDPVQEDTEPYYAVRGGSYSYYDDGAKYCRSAARNVRLNTSTSLGIGFRVALAPTKDMTIPLSEDVNLDMIWIKPGTFIMGSPEDELGGFDDETQHQVTLTKGYWLGRYEVTQAQYQAIMGTNPSNSKEADLPVECVRWNDATNFCAKLTAIEKAAGRLPEGYEYTLPTEAQWEYACRAGTTTALNSGKNLSDMDECSEMDEVGWYDGNSEEMTHPVGQKLSNAWGLYDMHGNVYEWCLDWHGDYPTSAVTDPTGPDTGSDRIYRGGAWDCGAYTCRSAYREYMIPTFNGSFDLGFRVALAPVK